MLNERGAQRALAAGLRHLQYVVSVSDTHSRHNAGASTDDAMATAGDVLALAAGEGAAVELTLATAFGCPYEHEVARRRRGRGRRRRPPTLGAAPPCRWRTPSASPPRRRSPRSSPRVRAATRCPLGVHLHDTRGLGVANALAAIDAGVVRIDGSVGALGGCPFAPGASGNLAARGPRATRSTHMGIATGVSLDGLIDAARLACGAVGRPVASHVGIAGPRFRTTAD